MFIKKFKSNIYLVALLIFFSIAINLSRFTSFSYAQSNGEPDISSNFEFYEYSEIEGTKENNSVVNIQLPEANWTVSNMQINFSDISLGSEIKVVEDSETDQDQVWNKNPAQRTFGLGSQLEILEITELFGVFIRGYKTAAATETIKFQIQGYDEGNNSPNNTIIRSIDLNISTNLNWYYQDFSSNPITLPVGKYSLVINGTNLPQNDQAKYYWQKNAIDPQNPFLHTSSYKNSWSTGVINTSYLYKLNQSVDRSYFPSDLNMTAEINGDNYEIINGSTIGTGSLEIADIDLFIQESNLIIPIKINESLILKFNFNYFINLIDVFTSEGSVLIEKSSNKWSISPIINRISQNDFVQFDIPKNWYNLTVYRNSENVSSLVNIDMINKSIIIPNNTIEDGADWEITAFSPNIVFEINSPETKWEAGQNLQFSVFAPINDANLTFIFFNPLEFEIYSEVIEIATEETILNYSIPSKPIEGIYTAKIYWNNETDAGIQSEEFEIFIKPPPPPYILYMIIGIVTTGLISIAGILSYRTIKNIRNKQAEKREKLYNSCKDVLNLDYIIVTDKKSGLNVYTQNFTDKKVDAALISGFLQAIHSFGIELIKVEDQSQTIKLEYKDSIVLMSEFVNIRLILLMKESPSRFFLYSIEELAYDIYKNYGPLIDNFNGDVKPFKSIETLLKQHLNVSFIYPLRVARIDKFDKIRITQNEKLFINEAVKYMKTNNQDYFLIKNILPRKECSPKDVETIIDLIDRKMLQITKINNFF